VEGSLRSILQTSIVGQGPKINKQCRPNKGVLNKLHTCVLGGGKGGTESSANHIIVIEEENTNSDEDSTSDLDCGFYGREVIRQMTHGRGSSNNQSSGEERATLVFRHVSTLPAHNRMWVPCEQMRSDKCCFCPYDRDTSNGAVAGRGRAGPLHKERS
jgi:hypothetical protein